MPTITPKDIDHVARLARIELMPEEREKITEHIGAILHYVEQLNEVNTDHVATTAQVTDQVNSVREDRVIPCEKREALLAAVPTTKDGEVQVKSVLE